MRRPLAGRSARSAMTRKFWLRNRVEGEVWWCWIICLGEYLRKGLRLHATGIREILLSIVLVVSFLICSRLTEFGEDSFEDAERFTATDALA